MARGLLELRQVLPQELEGAFEEVPGDGECFYWSLAVALRLEGARWLLKAGRPVGWSPLDEAGARAAHWRGWALQVRERAVARLLSAEFREVLAEEREFVMGWEEYGLWRCRRLRRSERERVVEQTGLAEKEWRVDRWRDMSGVSAELRQWQEQWSVQYGGLVEVVCGDGRVRKVVEEAVRAHASQDVGDDGGHVCGGMGHGAAGCELSVAGGCGEG